MNIKEFAANLDGREYGEEIAAFEELTAQEHGFVVVYAYSDDNMELRGAISDEFGCYDGGTAYLDKTGLLEECRCECKYYQEAKNQCKTITAVWDEDAEYTWHYETEIPHETFDIYEDGEKFCQGIVFSIADL